VLTKGFIPFQQIVNLPVVTGFGGPGCNTFSHAIINVVPGDAVEVPVEIKCWCKIYLVREAQTQVAFRI
jgi:hypothetical protein